jgi:hypothetical protein
VGEFVSSGICDLGGYDINRITVKNYCNTWGHLRRLAARLVRGSCNDAQYSNSSVYCDKSIAVIVGRA